MNPETIYAIALSISSSPASFDLWNLIRETNPENIYKESVNNNKLETAEFINKVYGENPLKCAEKIAVKCKKEKIDIIHLWDDRYPCLLKEISCPPVVLYSIGNLSHGKTAAIVGTRESDFKSEDIARKISSELGENGITIVSGIAIGIDRAAHLGALENGFPTIAVMANGIDVVYPKANSDIYGMILKSENSLILSEYPPGIVAGKWTFVRRNRIISGISLGTIVVKAGRRSGALITARYALEQNRHVFACGGNSFDEGYAGCYRLIKDGAVPVFSTEDILNELGIAGKVIDDPVKNIESDVPVENNLEDSSDFDKNSLEKKIMSYLITGAMEFDGIIRKCGTEVSETAEALMNLELCGYVSRKGNLISLTG
jgi:DNA processing protein